MGVKRLFSELSESFQGILEATLGIHKVIIGIQNSILGMASHNLSNTKATILGADPGAIPQIHGSPIKGLSLALAFSEHLFKNLGGAHARRLFLRCEA